MRQTSATEVVSIFSEATEVVVGAMSMSRVEEKRECTGDVALWSEERMHARGWSAESRLGTRYKVQGTKYKVSRRGGQALTANDW